MPPKDQVVFYNTSDLRPVAHDVRDLKRHPEPLAPVVKWVELLVNKVNQRGVEGFVRIPGETVIFCPACKDPTGMDIYRLTARLSSAGTPTARATASKWRPKASTST